jgi:hypothetical protein
MRFEGGPSKAKLARTQTNPSTFVEGVGFRTLPGAILMFEVPADGRDLFNVAFSAECRLFGAGPGDFVRIRVVDTTSNGGAVTTFLQPHDGNQAFCSADGYATHKGNWVRSAGPGRHTLSVQFSVFDEGNDSMEPLEAAIDDWTFELVVYE